MSEAERSEFSRESGLPMNAYGVRRQAKRDAAVELQGVSSINQSAVAAPLAGALHRVAELHA